MPFEEMQWKKTKKRMETLEPIRMALPFGLSTAPMEFTVTARR